jgi:outer membrane protein, heavy metal efflux system
MHVMLVRGGDMRNRLLFSFALVMLPAGVMAQGLTAPLQLTLADSLRLTAQSDVRLQGQQFQVRTAEARRSAAALAPAVRASIEVENALGTGSRSVTGEIEATLSLGTTLELGNKRAKRVAVADRERDRLDVEAQAARLDVFADVARRFLDVLHAQEDLAVARADKDLVLRAQTIVASRVQSAAASPVDSSNAEVAGIQAGLAEQKAIAEQRAAWAALVSAWGGSPESTGTAVGDILAIPSLPTFSSLEAAVSRNPDILVFAADRRLRATQVDLALATAQPDIDVSAGVRRFQDTRDQAFVVSASIPLGTVARSQPAEAEARATLAKAEVEEVAQRRRLIGLVFGLRQRAEAAAVALGQLQSKALPAAQRAQEQTEAAFRSGRTSFLELTATQHQLLELRRAKIETAVAYHLAVIELERLMGVSVTALSPTGAP